MSYSWANVISKKFYDLNGALGAAPTDVAADDNYVYFGVTYTGTKGKVIIYERSQLLAENWPSTPYQILDFGSGNFDKVESSINQFSYENSTNILFGSMVKSVGDYLFVGAEEGQHYNQTYQKCGIIFMFKKTTSTTSPFKMIASIGLSGNKYGASVKGRIGRKNSFDAAIYKDWQGTPTNHILIVVHCVGDGSVHSNKDVVIYKTLFDTSTDKFLGDPYNGRHILGTEVNSTCTTGISSSEYSYNFSIVTNGHSIFFRTGGSNNNKLYYYGHNTEITTNATPTYANSFELSSLWVELSHGSLSKNPFSKTVYARALAITDDVLVYAVHDSDGTESSSISGLYIWKFNTTTNLRPRLQSTAATNFFRVSDFSDFYSNDKGGGNKAIYMKVDTSKSIIMLSLTGKNYIASGTEQYAREYGKVYFLQYDSSSQNLTQINSADAQDDNNTIMGGLNWHTKFGNNIIIGRQNTTQVSMMLGTSSTSRYAIKLSPSNVANDTTAPSFSSAEVLEDYPKVVKLTFDEDIADNNNISGDDFSVQANNVSADISTIEVSSGKVNITLVNRIISTDTVTVGYTKSSTADQNIADAAGNAVDSFTAQNVTNSTSTSSSNINSLTIGQRFTIRNGTFTNSLIDNTTGTFIKNSIADGASALIKRRKRENVLKAIFEKNTGFTKFKMKLADLGLDTSTYNGTNINIIKPGQTFNIENDRGSNEGFYAVLDDGESVSFVVTGGTVKFTRDDVGNTELYLVTDENDLNLDPNSVTINTDNVSGTFASDNLDGTLQVGDQVILGGNVFIIGSVGDGGSSGSGADPYIFPIKSQIPVKLPNKKAFYRMFEQGKNYINVEVDRATPNHQNRMRSYALKITPTIHNVICNGFFYHKAYISAEGRNLTIDLNTKNVECSSADLDFFKIKEIKKIFNCGSFQEACKCFEIKWTTSKNKVISTQLMFFANPHIENGINVIPQTLKKSTGLIVENFKPKLMQIPSLTTKSYNKIWRRLQKSTNNYQKMNIKGKNEKWFFQ